MKEHYNELFLDAEVAYQIEYEEPHLEVRKNSVLLGVPRFHSLIFKGVVQGKEFNVLVDVGDTHNFIDTFLVEIKIFPMKKLEAS